MDEKVLCFLHIPKTGGTTLSAIIESHFSSQNIRSYDSWEKVANASPDWSSCKFLSGHISYDVWKVVPKPLVYMTILRHPIERVLSQFEFLRRSPDYVDYAKLQQMSFSDYVDDMEMREYFVNVQTRMIAASIDLHTLEDIKSVKEFIPPNMLAIAKERLHQFVFVGLTERMADSINLLSYTFGWNPHVSLQSLKVAPSGRLAREKLSPATLSKLQEFVQLDMELYEYATTLFNERLAHMLYALLEERYERSHASNPMLTAEELDFTFDQPFMGSGWHYREYQPHLGYYRWTGPATNSTLDLRLTTEQDLRISFTVIAACSLEVLESIILSANSRPIRLTHEIDQNNCHVFQGVIPSSMLALNPLFTRLRFTVAHTVQPSALDPDNPDPRLLGVAINRIRISPL